MLHTKDFLMQNLTQLTWTAEVSEYETEPVAGNPDIRIEFNLVGFMGALGKLYVGAMIQNVGHAFADDAVGNVATFPALGLYFSSVQPHFLDSQHGVELNVPPTVSPHFGRVFENIDGSGMCGKNIYTRTSIGEPSAQSSVVIQWTVTKRGKVVNPADNYSKALDGTWAPLEGTFVKWNFATRVNGICYDVADYYLPVDFAEYILPTDPLVLHQEYFGSADERLGRQKCTVRYTGVQTSDGTKWYPLNKWCITWRIDDEAGNKDSRFGWRSDGKSLTSSVGHDNDEELSARDVDHLFILI